MYEKKKPSSTAKAGLTILVAPFIAGVLVFLYSMIASAGSPTDNNAGSAMWLLLFISAVLPITTIIGLVMMIFGERIDKKNQAK